MNRTPMAPNRHGDVTDFVMFWPFRRVDGLLPCRIGRLEEVRVSLVEMKFGEYYIPSTGASIASKLRAFGNHKCRLTIARR